MSAYTDALNLAKHAQAFTREQWKHETNISATAHQREVTDLKKAGLNPVLSSGGSGASYTSTNSDSGISAASNVISSAKQAAATRYAAQQQAAATRAAAQAQIAAANISAAAMVETQKLKNKQDRYNIKHKPQPTLAGVLDKHGSNIFKKIKKFVNNNNQSKLNRYLNKSSAKKLANVGVSSFNFYNNFNNKGKNHVNNMLALMGIKNPTLKQRNNFARFWYTGKTKYYRAIKVPKTMYQRQHGF